MGHMAQDHPYPARLRLAFYIVCYFGLAGVLVDTDHIWRCLWIGQHHVTLACLTDYGSKIFHSLPGALVWLIGCLAVAYWTGLVRSLVSYTVGATSTLDIEVK